MCMCILGCVYMCIYSLSFKKKICRFNYKNEHKRIRSKFQNLFSYSSIRWLFFQTIKNISFISETTTGIPGNAVWEMLIWYETIEKVKCMFPRMYDMLKVVTKTELQNDLES